MLRKIRRLALARVLGARTPRSWLFLAGAMWGLETFFKVVRKTARVADTITLKPGSLLQVETTKPVSRRQRRRAAKKPRRS